jgi:hypothetical protein
MEKPQQLPKSPEQEPPKTGLSRREMLIGSGVLAGTVVAGAYLVKEGLGNKEGVQHESSELFNQKVKGFETLYSTIHRDEILFVDDDGAPVETVKISPREDVLPGKGDAVHQFDAHGLLIGELNPEWVAHERVRVCKKYPSLTCDLDRHLPHELNVLFPIRDAIENADEPTDPKTYLDIITHFGTKEVISGGGLDRIEYVKQRSMEDAKLPETLRVELMLLLPGLAAQESHFNNGLKSSTGAEGIFQFMPATWHELGRHPEQIRSLIEQVKAVSEYLERSYHQMHLSKHDFLTRIKANYFNDNEEDYQKYFIAPMLINSYNSGVGRLLEVARWYENHLGTSKTKEIRGLYSNGYGYDFYHRMTNEVRAHAYDEGYKHLAGYGRDSSEYFSRVYSLAQLLK